MLNNLFASVVAGLLIGLITGLAELYLFQRFFKRLSFLVLFLAKLLLYLASIMIIGVLTLFFYYMFQYDIDVLEAFDKTTALFVSASFYQLLLLGTYSSIFLNLILILKDNIGHSNFFPIITGKYHKPKEEDRIFLFLDLKSSTQMAETLGHHSYSELLQDCFNDLSNLIIKYCGNLYQFVGDEAVITWKGKRTSNYINSVGLFLAYKHLFRDKSTYYIDKYGLVPEFKGAINSGKVMVAEVGGRVKSEIAYHGDVLNTSARMLELCKTYNKNLLCSEIFYNTLQDLSPQIQTDFVDEVHLRGKNKAVFIFSIAETQDKVLFMC